MAQAFDATSSGNTTGTSLTVAHTCTGADRYLVVGCASTLPQTITGVTYAGATMTEAAAVNNSSAATKIKIFVLFNPASGANNIVLSASASTAIWSVNASYTGVKQVTGPDSSGTGAAASVTSLTVSTTTVADNCWLVGYFIDDGNANYSAGAGTTSRNAPASGIGMIADSNGQKSPAGSYSLVCSESIARDTTGIVISIAPPAAAVVGYPPTLLFMNAG